MSPIIYLTLLTILVAESYGEAGYQKSARDLHNKYRVKHHAPKLLVDEKLNANAVKCAKYYATKKSIDHSCPYKSGAGENLIGGRGTWTSDQFAKMGTDSWYNEVSKYNYNKPGFSMSTGHFTQLVWKGSKKFGFGVSTVNGFTTGVGLYSPPGNYKGQFPQNVLKP